MEEGLPRRGPLAGAYKKGGYAMSVRNTSKKAVVGKKIS